MSNRYVGAGEGMLAITNQKTTQNHNERATLWYWSACVRSCSVQWAWECSREWPKYLSRCTPMSGPPGSWFSPGPSLVVVGTWEVTSRGKLSPPLSPLSPFLSPHHSAFQIHKHFFKNAQSKMSSCPMRLLSKISLKMLVKMWREGDCSLHTVSGMWISTAIVETAWRLIARLWHRRSTTGCASHPSKRYLHFWVHWNTSQSSPEMKMTWVSIHQCVEGGEVI